MFRHLLVPLDGLPMSETAVTVGEHLARRDGAEVTLLHVLEQSVHPTVHGQRHLTDYRQAAEYLEGIIKRFGQGIKVGYHVHRHPVKDVAADLARHADIMEADLIILCAHGRVRLRDRILGNIAQQIVEALNVPVLMLQSKDQGIVCPFRKMLLLLDTKPEHESAVSPAVSLAKSCSAEMVLMHVVETDEAFRTEESVGAGMMPNTARQLADLKEQNAKQYLQNLIEKIGKEGVSVSGCIDRGNAAERIIDYVQRRGVDIVVLGTHGKTGANAFWAGTLPPRLMRRLGAVSFLLVPA